MMPTPYTDHEGLISTTSAAIPRRASATAVVSPPTPPPTMSTLRILDIFGIFPLHSRTRCPYRLAHEQTLLESDQTNSAPHSPLNGQIQCPPSLFPRAISPLAC